MIFRRKTARRAILKVLYNDINRWWFGLELMREINTISGVFYPALYDLEAQGLVESRWAQLEPGRRYRRRLYKISSQ